MLGERAAVPDVTTHALALSKPATDFAAAVSALDVAFVSALVALVQAVTQAMTKERESGSIFCRM